LSKNGELLGPPGYTLPPGATHAEPKKRKKKKKKRKPTISSSISTIS
jgi:hypothetical protein